MKNLITLCCFSLMIGCGPAAEEVANDDSLDDSLEESTDWWEVEGEANEITDDDGTGDGDKGDGGKEDGNKPEGGATAGGSWTAVIDTSNLTGLLGYVFSDENQAVICDISYAVTVVDAQATCDACTFSWGLALDALTVNTGEGDDCAGNDGMADTTIDYGQGAALLSEYAGINYYPLMTYKNGAWSEVEGGHSTFDEDSSQWDFGIK